MHRFLFVHIPKAAGSSVNKFFEKALGPQNCNFHLESTNFLSDSKFRRDVLRDKMFLSGHIPYKIFMSSLNEGGFFVFTALRHPYSHVVSHVSWIRKLAEPSEIQRFKNHPVYVQKLSLKLAEADLSSPEVVSSLLKGLTEEEFALLDNVQVRYLRSEVGPHQVTNADIFSAVNTLREMSYFGFLEKSEEFFDYLSETLGVSGPSFFPSENKLENKYGMSPCDKALMSAFEPLIQHDIALYDQALKIYDNRVDGEFGKLPFNDAKVVGVLDRASGGIVSGWARYEGLGANIPLDVVVNGKVLGTIFSNGYRPDLKEKFGVDCAFHYQVNVGEVANGDKVEVRVSGEGVNLKNSPAIYSE